MRIEFGVCDVRNGEVGELRRACSFCRICGGKVVVFAGQRVLSLSRTRARMFGMRGGFFSVLVGFGLGVRRCGPRSSGR